nr:unnamed protein product [Callosobruchus chinensis]CAH7736117.1 unnamed protein product [Callosobruchus chinensis]CAH7749372.1 unnamed protein product [Callosobruchus chinensis]
MEMMLSVMSN